MHVNASRVVVFCTFRAGGRQVPLRTRDSEQFQAGMAIHRKLDHFDSVDLAFYLAAVGDAT